MKREDIAKLNTPLSSRRGVGGEAFKTSARQLLEENILPFWLDKMIDHEHGGFYGRMDGQGRLHAQADKGAVLNARILWTFAAAYRVLGKQEYLAAAIRAKEYILKHFIDKKRDGIYWSVNYKGEPVDMKKQSYAIGFAIYGMSELYRAAGDKEALNCAIALFETLEIHTYDAKNVGYIEALTYDWFPIGDMRLSYKDENGSRTMNTHLHILEPYTNLYRVWKDQRLECQLRTLINIFTDKLLNPVTRHLDLFFNDEWQGKRNIESFGHDIEAAWLLTEALEVLGDKRLTDRVMPIVSDIAAASEEGLCHDGSMIHERTVTVEGGSPFSVDTDRHWWVQCENVIGQLNQYQHFHDEQALQKAQACYQFILDHLVDREGGEWYWSIRPDGSVNRDDDKAGPWKCPYHNSRMCLEIMEREF
jgi:mannobiose 2-epimerase